MKRRVLREAATVSTVPHGGHDRRGRFAPGNAEAARTGPARTKAKDLRLAFCSAVSEEDLRRLARRLYTRALAGDIPAARLLMGYAVGREVGPIDGEDGYDPQEQFL